MISFKVILPGILIPMFAAMVQGAEVRCGLSSLSPDDLASFAVGSIASRLSVDATGSKLFETPHFAIWYRTGGDSDALEAPWDVALAGDSIPRMIRVASRDLEHAWSVYVDSMGMLPPLPAPTGTVIGGTTPAGKYPVEFCRPERALSKSYWTSQFYGLTNPYGPDPGKSTVLLSSRILGSSWNYPLDTGGRLTTSYRMGDGWLEAMRATAVHELFHASQFRYERTLKHFLFEASAVAMESRVLPDNLDHLYYLAALYGQLEGAKTPTRGILVSNSTLAYRHGLFVMGLVSDRGDATLGRLWSDRAARAPSDPSGTTILGTMNSVLDGTGLTWRESLIRYGMRIALGGDRRNWTSTWNTVPAFAPWSHAALAPIEDSILETPAANGRWLDWNLAGGELHVVSDPGIAGDLQVHWIADDGAFLVRIDSTVSGFVRQEIPTGTVVVPASSRANSRWIVGCDGTSSSAANPNRSVNSAAHLSFSRPLLAVQSTRGQPFRYVFPRDTLPDGRTTGGQILTGTSLVTDSVLPVLDSGAFVPDPQSDREGATLAATGSTWFLSDARGRIRLQDANLDFPGHGEPFGFRFSSSKWTRVRATTSSPDTLRLDLGELALDEPTRWILTGVRAVTPQLMKVYPNPSIEDQPVHFEISGTTDGIRLTILAADGSLVRSWRNEQFGTKIDWDLRNTNGNRVRPGVYSWFIEGPGLSKHGRLLVAR